VDRDLQTTSTSFSDCVCDEPSANGLYCHKWGCDELEDKMSSLFTCSDPNTAESTSAYCSHWSGQAEWAEKFSLSDCACGLHSSSGAFCDSWICLTKETDYWAPDLSWLWFTVFVCALPQVAVLFLQYRDGVNASKNVTRVFMVYLLGMVLFAVPLIVAGVLNAGLVVLLVCGVQVFVLPFFCFLYIMLTKRSPETDLTDLESVTENKYARIEMSEHLLGDTSPFSVALVVVGSDLQVGLL
jgi:hypothetical protein